LVDNEKVSLSWLKYLPIHWTGAGSSSLPTGKKINPQDSTPFTCSIHVFCLCQDAESRSQVTSPPIRRRHVTRLSSSAPTYKFQPDSSVSSDIELYISSTLRSGGGAPVTGSNNNVEYSRLFLDPTEVRFWICSCLKSVDTISQCNC
jgi:hypothetical protein